MRTELSVSLVVVLSIASAGRSVGVAQQGPPAQEEPRGAGETTPSQSVPQAERARIARGFEIAPVPLDLEGKDRRLVGLGSYIVNAQAWCNECHTNPPYAEGGNPFLAQPEIINASRYLAGGTFFGPFRSRNLTPEVGTGLPAGLTWEEFRITLLTGHDWKQLEPRVPHEARDILQVMPWPIYSHMTDRDLRAIYEFLRAIPSLPSEP